MFIRNDFNLRPLTELDLDIVLKWRNSESIRSNMFTDHIIAMDEHRSWYKNLKNNTSNQCLIFEFQGSPLGVTNISQIDTKNNKCYWGFYLGEPTHNGFGLIMGYFALNYIFETMQIRKLCGEVLDFNKASYNFHKKLGFSDEGCFKAHIFKNGHYIDVKCLALFRDEWLRLSKDIAKKCFGEN